MFYVKNFFLHFVAETPYGVIVLAITFLKKEKKRITGSQVSKKIVFIWTILHRNTYSAWKLAE